MYEFVTRTSRRLIAAVVLLAATASAHADWVISPDVEAVRPAPGNFEVQAQNPPAFAWSRHPKSPASYIVEVWHNGSVAFTYNSNRNWYLPTKAYAPGHYAWRVRPNTSTVEWSNKREFDITAASQVFEVPDSTAIRMAVIAKQRPRQLPAGFLKLSQWTAAMTAERKKAYDALVNEVKYKSIKPVADSDWPLSATGTLTAAQSADIRQRVNATARQLESAALLYRLTGNAIYLTEVNLRGDQLANLSPTGPTSYARQDQATRQIALALMKAVDMIYYSLDATRRARWVSIVAQRTPYIYNALAGSNGRIDQYPFDSHGGTNLGFLALISTLAIGDIPASQVWLEFSVRAYINAIYSWSGPEGGYANGTAYGQYTADYALQIWQPLMQATGVNLFEKPWSHGFMRFFAHFVPPGASSHLFGDEKETAPDFRMMKAYASRFKSPEAAWYARNITGDEDALTFLQAPYPLPYTQVTPVAPPNAALYPSIGWVAMHSNLSDRMRTSLYFKSSPYGSYNHSHGDQNSIVLVSGGRPLLIETGYLDSYGSLLWQNWYRQTKAHNAVTYDGGLGQLVDGNTINLSRNGKVTAFSTSATLDFAEGTAQAAYGAAVSTALRKVWYLRTQDAVLVQDKMAAPLARKWEWNLHAPAPIVLGADGSVSITNVDRSLCIRPLLTNIYPVSYQVRTGPAPKAGKVEVHGAFVTPARTSTDFLMLLDVGCKKPAVSMTETTTSRTFMIGTQSVTVPK
jgi:hypothetical protein